MIYLVAIGLAPVASTARAQAEASAFFTSANVYLVEDPQQLSLVGQGLAAFRGLELELAYDAESVAITALAPGSLVTSVRPDAQIELRSAAPGKLRLVIDLGGAEADAEPTSEGREDPSAAADPAWPQGAGELVVITLAPLAKRDDPVALEVRELTVWAADGPDDLGLTVPAAEVTVAQDPAAEKREAYLAEVAALQPAGFSLGRLLGGANLPGSLADLGPQGMWWGLLLLSTAFTLLAWSMGRRPTVGTIGTVVVDRGASPASAGVGGRVAGLRQRLQAAARRRPGGGQDLGEPPGPDAHL